MRGFSKVELRLDNCVTKNSTFRYQLQAVSRDRHALVPKQSPGSGSHEPLVKTKPLVKTTLQGIKEHSSLTDLFFAFLVFLPVPCFVIAFDWVRKLQYVSSFLVRFLLPLLVLPGNSSYASFIT